MPLKFVPALLALRSPIATGVFFLCTALAVLCRITLSWFLDLIHFPLIIAPMVSLKTLANERKISDGVLTLSCCGNASDDMRSVG